MCNQNKPSLSSQQISNEMLSISHHCRTLASTGLWTQCTSTGSCGVWQPPAKPTGVCAPRVTEPTSCGLLSEPPGSATTANPSNATDRHILLLAGQASITAHWYYKPLASLLYKGCFRLNQCEVSQWLCPWANLVHCSPFSCFHSFGF